MIKVFCLMVGLCLLTIATCGRQPTDDREYNCLMSMKVVRSRLDFILMHSDSLSQVVPEQVLTLSDFIKIIEHPNSSEQVLWLRHNLKDPWGHEYYFIGSKDEEDSEGLGVLVSLGRNGRLELDSGDDINLSIGW